MSHVALQRVMVRMLWDPAFVARVYATPEVALAGDDLSPHEIAWVTRPDRRAWSTDPHRRSRTLHGLLEEFPASGALAARHERGLFFLDRFFSSTTFHACIRDGASLARAFGAYLGREVSADVGDPRVRVLAAVEGEIAALRRDAPPPPPAGRLVLRPGTRLLEAPRGTPALLAEITRRLATHPQGPVAAIAARALALDGLPPIAADHEVSPLLALRGPAGDVSLEDLSAALAALLRAAAGDGATRGDLRLVARSAGADPGEEDEILDGLVADGLLVPT